MIKTLLQAGALKFLKMTMGERYADETVSDSEEKKEVTKKTIHQENDLERQTRKTNEFRELVESVIKQRDTWKDMFYEQSHGHHAAQIVLELELTKTREMVMRCVQIVNSYREKNGEPKVENPFKDLGDPPIGSSNQFKSLIARLEDLAPKPMDAQKERDNIESS